MKARYLTYRTLIWCRRDTFGNDKSMKCIYRKSGINMIYLSLKIKWNLAKNCFIKRASKQNNRILHILVVTCAWIRIPNNMMTSSNGNTFRVTGWAPVNSPHKGQWRGAFIFSLRLNKPLSKQSWGWRFETLSPPLWRHCNEFLVIWYTRVIVYWMRTLEVGETDFRKIVHMYFPVLFFPLSS